MHHEDGIKMAEMELRSGKEPGMRRIAQKVIDSQSADVKPFDT